MASDPERSTTIDTFTSRRVTVAAAAKVVEVKCRYRMNKVGTVAWAVTVTVLWFATDSLIITSPDV